MKWYEHVVVEESIESMANCANPTVTFEAPSSTIRGILAALQKAKSKKATFFQQDLTNIPFYLIFLSQIKTHTTWDFKVWPSVLAVFPDSFFKALRSQLPGFAMAPDERNHTYYEFWQKSALNSCIDSRIGQFLVVADRDNKINGWMVNMWWYVVICCFLMKVVQKVLVPFYRGLNEHHFFWLLMILTAHSTGLFERKSDVKQSTERRERFWGNVLVPN